MKRPKVLGEFVLAIKVEKPKGESLILTPTTVVPTEPQEYLVISTGNDVKGIQDGDIILMNGWNGRPIPLNGRDYVLIHAEHIFAVMVDE